MGITIHAKHVHVENGTLRLRQYADGTLAVQIEYIEHDDGFDYPESETLSVNMSAYLPAPAPAHFYVKDYAENEGLAEALVQAGVAEVVGDPIHFGPFNTTVRLVRLTDKVLAESTLTGTHRDYAVGDVDDTPNDAAVCRFEWSPPDNVGKWVCTRYPDHNGNHAAGTGTVIAAVHPREA